jgi:hypothetical protein
MRLQTTCRKEKTPLRPAWATPTTRRQRKECGKGRSLSVGRRGGTRVPADYAQNGEEASLTRIRGTDNGKATERRQKGRSVSMGTKVKTPAKKMVLGRKTTRVKTMGKKKMNIRVNSAPQHRLCQG